MPSNEPAVKPSVSRETHALSVSDLHALREAISPPRLGTYLRSTEYNSRRALKLYAWNMRAGAALLPVLQANEVTLRNAVSSALVSQFGEGWPYSQGFLRSLPKHDSATFVRERGRTEKRLGLREVSTGDVVASQTYWYWVALLTSRFEDRVWSREFRRCFPHAPPGVTRQVVHDRAETIRRLRNRIAHHEPLLSFDLLGAYNRAVAIVRWISPAKAAWVVREWPPTRDLIP
jgi:hypothetical protein